MKRRLALLGGLAAAIAMIGVARLATAAPPAGYKCGKGGKKNAGAQRCECPAGKQAGRNAADEAVCTAAPRRPARAPRAAAAAAVPAGASCPDGMVLLAGGTFVQGDRYNGPPRRVTLSPYCIDRTEVTVAAYAACAACAPASTSVHHPKGFDRWDDLWHSSVCNANRSDRQDHPVNCVEWSDADRYCRAVGKRLPTEAEWELAARGTAGREYPWGKQDPTGKRLNAFGPEGRAFVNGLGYDNPSGSLLYLDDDGHGGTAPVGSYPAGATPTGILDLAGNVGEWVADEYAPYPPGAVTDPPAATTATPGADKKYVHRGGGFYRKAPGYVQGTNRAIEPPQVRGASLGFRCGADIELAGAATP